MVAIASQYGCPQRSRTVSHIVLRVRLPASHNNAPQHIVIFFRCYNSCLMMFTCVCNGELTERVLELPVMVYADDLKGGVTHSIREI